MCGGGGGVIFRFQQTMVHAQLFKEFGSQHYIVISYLSLSMAMDVKCAHG